MAIAGAWRAKQSGPVGYSASRKWGTGVNPVHSVRTNEGRNIAPGTPGGELPGEFLSQDEYDLEMGYCVEDNPSVLYGYGPSTGTSDHPPLGSENVDTRMATTPGYPSYGNHSEGLPGGTVIRTVDHGAEIGYATKLEIPDAFSGWENKQESYVNDSDVSNPSQYEIQTSMAQRDKVRAGSQRGDASASEYSAPVKSRTPGMRAYMWAGGQRHDDMQPKAQEQIIRPFWLRTAGTGDPKLMAVNELYQSVPIQRTPPEDPYQGGEQSQSADMSGFTGEDILPYV